jgi:opacity protein-like surface antigen
MTQPFGSHSNSAFTYSVGLGIDVNIAEHWRLGAGYRFLDLGGASLGVSGLQSGTRTISNSHIHANELLLQVSFVG